MREAGIDAAGFHCRLSLRERISSFPAVLSRSERRRWAMPPMRTIVAFRSAKGFPLSRRSFRGAKGDNDMLPAKCASSGIGTRLARWLDPARNGSDGPARSRSSPKPEVQSPLSLKATHAQIATPQRPGRSSRCPWIVMKSAGTTSHAVGPGVNESRAARPRRGRCRVRDPQ